MLKQIESKNSMLKWENKLNPNNNLKYFEFNQRPKNLYVYYKIFNKSKAINIRLINLNLISKVNLSIMITLYKFF